MSGFLYRGRHCTGNREAIPKSTTHMDDFSSDETEKGPPLQTHSLREFEKHLNDLKKENFSLKLRIYFLEERIQGRCEDSSSEDVHRKNIELKVEVESLKQELLERQQQLDKVLTTETQSNQNGANVQHHCEEKQQEISHIQEVLENKIQQLQEESKLARSEAEKMASLAASESQRCAHLEDRIMTMEAKETQEEMLADKERRIQTLTGALVSKEEEVRSLHEERNLLTHKASQLEEEVQVLSKLLQQKENNVKSLEDELEFGKNLKQIEMQKLISEQQVQLVQYENAAGQCVTELQKAQLQVQSLQTKIRESEANNKKLQQRLGVMECELMSFQERAQGQERTIQTISDSLSTKDNEVADLQQLIEEQKQLLISLKMQSQHEQLQRSTTEPSLLQAQLLELQASLFSTQLELQSVQRAQRQAQMREDDLTRANQRLLNDLQALQDHRREAELHNQELLAALQRARSDLEQMEEKWKEGKGDKESEVEERERTIRDLKTRLQHKEQLLHDYTELLDGQKEAGGSRDVLVHKLKLRIQERDRALERAVDERFVCVEQKETEVRKLQLLLREKERDLQKLRCVLSNNEETITSLEVLLRGKSIELEQVNEAWRGSQRVQRECEDRHNCSMRERDTLISQLQTALHTRTKDAEELTAALLSKLPLSSGEVVEKLKAQLQIKERLFQELLAEHGRQTQEHHTHIQELLNAAHTREQCIKDSAERAGKVMSEQTARLQELRMQVRSAGSRSPSAAEPFEDAQLLQDELRLVLSKDKEAQRELSVLRSALANTQEQLLTQTSQLNSLNHTSKPEHLVPMETEHAASSHTDTGDSTSDVEEEEGGISDFTESTEEEEHGRVSAQALFNKQGYEQHGGPVLSQTPAEVEGQGLAEVKLLVEQKKAVERKLWELKAQLENAGFTSFSQMRRALLSLRMENEELRNTVRRPEPEEETHTLLEEQRARGVQWQSEPCEGKKRCSRVLCLDAGTQLSHSTQPVQKPVPKLQEKFIVSKPTIQTQAERLRDSKEQRMETPVQHNSKQVQVDLQDLGYETCGRSENEAEREDTSSPEFDDLELCTSLSCRDGTPQWWSGLSATDRAGGDVASLQQQVEDLQVQLSRSQALVLRLQSRHQDSTPNSTPGKSNREDRELQELVTRVSSLEEQLRKGKGHTAEEPKSSTRTGNFDTLIQAQARELSHLRQRLREGRSVCHILTQHLGDTTKSFEELLRDNDIDYYMGQSFRDQLAQSSALAQRVAAKISSRDYSEIPDDKTGHELLAIRLSKELQQKDKLIESLHSKLELQQQRADTPTSSRSLSGEADQLDRGSFVIDEQGSTNEDLDLCSELDTVSEFGQDEVADDPLQPAQSHPHPSNPPSVTSSHGHQSSSCCPSMHCAPLIQTELSSAPLPQKPQCLSAQMAFLPFDPQTQHLRPRSNTTGGFSLAEVHQELQRLQRELANSFSSAQVKPLPGVFHQTDHNDFHLPPQHVFQQSPFASLHASPGMTYGVQLKRESTYNDISSSSSGYQSGARHTGTDLMEEHLREIRSLHRRLEESIQTNERLRQQLAERLDSSKQDGGAPTNIYIQGLDSLNQLSNEVQFLKEENQALQSQLQQASREGMKQVEQLRDAVLVEHTRLEQAELEAERWAGQFRQLQAQMREQTQVALQLKQDKQISQENANRLQHEVNILQQQLSESRRLVLTLQRELETYRRTCETTHTDSQEPEMQEAACRMHMLEQQLSDRLDPEVLHISARKHLFHDPSSSPPVRGTGALNPASALSAQLQFSVARSGLNKSEAPDGLFACRTGCHVVGHWDDFSSLQQQLLEGKVFICKMETALQSTMEINLHEDCVRNLLTSTKTLKQILEDIGSVLRMFWRAALPSTETTSPHEKEKPLPDEVVALRHKLAEQEQTLRETMESLKNSNRTKDSMEQFIVSQLTRTRDVLKKAHTNLQKNELRINSLGCSFLPPSPQSFSFTPPWASRGEVSNTGCSSSSGPSIMTPGHDPHKPVQRVVKHFGMQRPLQMFSGSERTTLHIHAAAPTPC